MLYYLSAGNTLYYPTDEGFTVNAFREIPREPWSPSGDYLYRFTVGN